MSAKFHTLDLAINVIQKDKLIFPNTILGRGAQGVVLKGKYLGSDVAIKSIFIDKTKTKYFSREMNL